MSDAPRMPPTDLSNDDLANAALAARANVSQHKDETRPAREWLKEYFGEQAPRFGALTDPHERHSNPGHGT